MGPPWTLHGISMNSSMDSPWTLHVLSMDSMGRPWILQGFSMESPWALGLIILGPLFLPKLLIGTDEKVGPVFGSQIEPAKRVDPLWVHPFCGLHFGPKCGRCFCGLPVACC